MAILFIERGFRLVLFDRQSASWVVPSFAPRLRGVRLILRALASSSHVKLYTVSRHRVRQTSVVFCEARAFLVRSSLICRNSQLASSAMIQGLCVVFCGLGYAWSNSRQREGGLSRGARADIVVPLAQRNDHFNLPEFTTPFSFTLLSSQNTLLCIL